jgi:transposase
MEIIAVVDLLKKSLPKIVAKEIVLKKKNRLKKNVSNSVLGSLNKLSTRESNPSKSKK